MNPHVHIFFAAILWLALPVRPQAAEPLKPPEIPAITAAMQEVVDKQEAAGAVTLVATPDKIVHLSAVGFADSAA